MRPKPAHLAPEYGAQFQDGSVAAAYPSRPPYPAATFVALANLIGEGPRIVLDVGCGTGDIARRLAPLMGRVEAIDASAAMLERGCGQQGGDAPNLAWVHASVEDAPLRPPYGLITAGESLHWLDWEIVFLRFAEALSPGGALAIIGREGGWSPAFTARLQPIIDRYSTNRDFRPYNLTDELTTRGLFELMGTQRIAAETWHPTIAEYIEFSTRIMACRASGWAATRTPSTRRRAPHCSISSGRTRSSCATIGSCSRSRRRSSGGDRTPPDEKPSPHLRCLVTTLPKGALSDHKHRASPGHDALEDAGATTERDTSERRGAVGDRSG